MAKQYVQPIIGRGHKEDDDDLPLPVRGGVFGDAVKKIVKDGLASRDFVVPISHNSGWIFRMGHILIYPCAVRITADGQLWVRWTFRKAKHASEWYRLRRQGVHWHADLPLGDKGGKRSAKLDNRHFPLIAVETTRMFKRGVGEITAFDGGCCSWSGPGQHMLHLENSATVTGVRVWQHLTGGTIYKVVAWITDTHARRGYSEVDGPERRMAFSAASIADARIDGDGYVINEQKLVEIGIKHLAAFI